ncbi:MAG: hypothetical protein P8X50_01265 [Maritimibacter sp.]|jgi:hypothetical protein
MPYDSLPSYDMSDNETGCCPRFHPEGWDGLELSFENKLFVRAETRSFFHIPLNYGAVFPRVQANLEAAGAFNPDDFLILSKEVNLFKEEHFFAAGRNVPGEEMTRLSGNFVSKVFEGPYQNAKRWYDEMKSIARARGKPDGAVYFFYTTCPKCAKHYGKNYVVGFAEV